MQRALVAVALAGCMVPEESLDLDAPAVSEQAYGGYAAEPEDAPLDVVEAIAPGTRPRRGSYFAVLEDPREWIDDNTGAGACEGDALALPAVSADGSVLALGLATVVVADEHAATIRRHRVDDGAMIDEHVLLHRGEWRRLSETEAGMDELQRRYCRRLAAAQEMLVADAFATMPVVGAWANPIRRRLPADAWPWPYVVNDGAKRELDMAVTDIVIARPDAEQPALELRPGAEKRCRREGSEFSKVWSTATIAVYTRGPCGC